ncbi:MAG: polysaccharide biosynthesis protein [Rikenellaceae bacterium]
MIGKIVITGISGVLSRALISYISKNYPDTELVGIARNRCDVNNENIHLVSQHLCDISKCAINSGDNSFDNLCEAIKNADILIHTAAIKRVSDCEELPMDAIKTNILGTQNIIDAAVKSGVKQIVNISSDMSVEPIGVYGATKLLQSKLITDAFKTYSIKTCNIRFGNIFTRAGGTILHFFDLKYNESGVVPVTHPEMSRFGEVDSRVAELVFCLAEKSLGGETFIPKFKSYDIMTAVAAVSPKAQVEIVGMRQGEKLAEIMISKNESESVVETSSYYCVVPSFCSSEKYKLHHKASSVVAGFSLTSENNPNRYTTSELREVMQEIGVVSSEKI